MKLSKEFEEKFKGVMQADNAVQVCEAIRDWLEEKEKQGEFRPFNALVIPAETLKALTELQMVSDPYPLSPVNKQIIEEFLDDQSGKHGFDGWIEAYHNL